MSWFLFILLSVVSLGGGLGVVVTRNVVHAALFLLVSLVAVAGLYLVLLAEFLALVQVMMSLSSNPLVYLRENVVKEQMKHLK